MVGGGEMTPEDSQGRLSVEDSSSHVPPAKEPPRLDARESHGAAAFTATSAIPESSRIQFMRSPAMLWPIRASTW